MASSSISNSDSNGSGDHLDSGQNHFCSDRACQSCLGTGPSLVERAEAPTEEQLAERQGLSSDFHQLRHLGVFSGAFRYLSARVSVS